MAISKPYLIRLSEAVIGSFASSWFVILFLSSAFGVEPLATTNSEAVQREKLLKRFWAEAAAEGITNLSAGESNFLVQATFDQMVVHPSLGLRWDEVPAPTIVDTNALVGVQAFVATNGWNMHNGKLIFTYGLDKPKVIRGLPWEVIRDREFRALTREGILYVIFSGWHHDCNGVAYNPRTNDFPAAIQGFKHIGQHWYVWTQRERPTTLPQQYEGQKLCEPNASGDGKPSRSP
jgi:hypothetical protein